MGQNLSSKVSVDTSPDVIGAGDAKNELILLIMWAGAIYGIAMIWSTVELCDRWRGPQGNRQLGFVSVLAALLLSAAWPVVFLYLLLTR